MSPGFKEAMQVLATCCWVINVFAPCFVSCIQAHNDVDMKSVSGMAARKSLARLLNDSRWAARMPQSERFCASSLALATLASED
jgi:hypothetical protein